MTFAPTRMDSSDGTVCITNRRSLGIVRLGVTLLELMIALSVLSVLMLVAWSLFSNLQKAEERSGGLARRVQLLRQARAWLVADLDQLERKSNAISTGLNAPNVPMFRGDSTGFVAAVVPSLNPLPFLQGAFESSVDSEPVLQSVFDTDEERQVNKARESIWPEETLNVEYRLEPQSQLPLGGSALDDSILFRLVRREFLPGPSSDLSESDDNTAKRKNKPGAADRQLSIRDLYRQTDEESELGASPLREKQLDGLTQASFRYFNGRVWQDDWNSKKEGGPPLAIALQFDYPSRAVARRALTESTSDDAETANSSLAAQTNSIDSLLEQQPKATLEQQSSSEFLVASKAEVTIVVATHASPIRDVTKTNSALPIEGRL